MLPRSVADLVEGLLQVGGTHAFSQVSVRRVCHEELPLGRHGSRDVLLSINILLAAVYYTNVACRGRYPHTENSYTTEITSGNSS